jgi:hypothetical protein
VPANIADGVAGNGRRRRRRSALERHVQQIDAGALLQYLHRQMVLAAVAAGSVRQRRRGAAGVLDEFLEALDRQGGIDREHELIRRHGRDRREGPSAGRTASSRTDAD